MTTDVSELILFYFELGFYYKDIALILQLQHDVKISLRQLKRKLSNIGLYRRRNFTDLETMVTFIQKHSSEQMHGYRWMYQKCILGGLNVRKEDVRLLLQIIDPEGTLRRKKHSLHRRKYASKGSNFCWHIDSYDKLKKYGLCINGAIDGFSRKILWLKVGPSNSDPKVIGKYFVDAVKEHGGCPTYMRGDMGTENTNVAFMQNYLRGDEIECKAFLYGRSTMNTKIESWWNILRKECCGIWIEKLRSIGEDGLFTGNYLDKGLIQFCSMKLLQDQLDEVVMVWNTHRIRPSRRDLPAGRPIQLYLFPEVEMADNCLCQVSQDNLDFCNTYCAEDVTYPCDEDLFQLCCLQMEENGWMPPRNVDEALELYLNLRPLHVHLNLFQ